MMRLAMAGTGPLRVYGRGVAGANAFVCGLVSLFFVGVSVVGSSLRSVGRSATLDSDAIDRHHQRKQHTQKRRVLFRVLSHTIANILHHAPSRPIRTPPIPIPLAGFS